MISVRVDFNILCSPTNHDFLASGNLNTDFITMSRQQILIVVRAVPAVTIYRCLGQSLGLPLPKKPLVMRSLSSFQKEMLRCGRGGDDHAQVGQRNWWVVETG